MSIVGEIDLGFVTRRDDPEGRGRIKVQVPGVIEPESPNWVEEIGGVGGGGAQRGTFDPPDVGATVAVFCHRGNQDRLFFARGPYGAPGNASDVPTDGEVEGDDRALVSTEDEEWLIQRDSMSTSSPQRYRVKHKSSGAEIVIESDDNIRITRQSASQAFVRGTEYRLAEKTYMSALHSAIATFATACKASGDPTLSGAASALETALSGIVGSDYITDQTAYLSDKFWGE